MFTKPAIGWTTFEYNGIKVPCSYLIDVPQTWTDILLAYFKKPEICGNFILPINEEGQETYLLFTWEGSYALRVDSWGNPRSANLEADIDEFIEEYCNDIELYIDDWTKWSIDDLNEQAFKERKEKIQQKVGALRDALDATTRLKMYYLLGDEEDDEQDAQ